MAGADPDRWIVVAADGEPDKIAARVLEAVEERAPG
jgi:hypothetical protein